MEPTPDSRNDEPLDILSTHQASSVELLGSSKPKRRRSGPDVALASPEGKAATKKRKRHETRSGTELTPVHDIALAQEPSYVSAEGFHSKEIARMVQERNPLGLGLPSTRTTEPLSSQDINIAAIEANPALTVDPKLLTRDPASTGTGRLGYEPVQRHQHRQVVDESAQGSLNLSATRSSIGGYETVDLDFRGNGIAVDVSPSVPFEGTGSHQSQWFLPGTNLPVIGQQFATIGENKEEGHGSQTGTGSRRRSKSVATQIESTVSTVPVLSPESKPKNKKSLTRRTPSSHSASSHPPSSRSESEHPSQRSIAEPTPKESKYGRRRKSDLEVSISYEPSSDELAIGLPKEQYRPRPSRSRRGTVEAPERTDSPEKPLSSEFNLSDELVIGIPKEQYKPRPTRSRTKPVDTSVVLHSEEKPESI